MRTSEQIDKVSSAFAKAQAAIQNPAKDGKNDHFGSSYATLAAGLNAVRCALADQELAVIQTTGFEGDVLILTTRLVHSSGQWFEGDYPICKFPVQPQQAVSATTYARRNSLFAIVGIAGEDDDGNEANKVETPAPKKQAPRLVEREPSREPKRENVGEYLGILHGIIDAFSGKADDFAEWWREEKPRMAAAGVDIKSPEFTELYVKFTAKGKALRDREAA